MGKAAFFFPHRPCIFRTCLMYAYTDGIVGKREGFSVDGTIARITKIMANDPRRIGEIVIQFELPANHYTVKERHTLSGCQELSGS